MYVCVYSNNSNNSRHVLHGLLRRLPHGRPRSSNDNDNNHTDNVNN